MLQLILELGTKTTDTGCLITFGEGIEGLITLSEMNEQTPKDRELVKANKVYLSLKNLEG